VSSSLAVLLEVKTTHSSAVRSLHLSQCFTPPLKSIPASFFPRRISVLSIAKTLVTTPLVESRTPRNQLFSTNFFESAAKGRKRWARCAGTNKEGVRSWGTVTATPYASLCHVEVCLFRRPARHQDLLQSFSGGFAKYRVERRGAPGQSSRAPKVGEQQPIGLMLCFEMGNCCAPRTLCAATEIF